MGRWRSLGVAMAALAVAGTGCSTKLPGGSFKGLPTAGGATAANGMVAAGGGNIVAGGTASIVGGGGGNILTNNASGILTNNASGIVAGGTASLVSNNAGGLTGSIRGPAAGLIANNAAGILTNNASGIITNNAGGLVSNNAGGLVSNNAGGILTNNASGYALLQAAGELSEPCANVEVAVFDEAGNEISFTHAITDADGKYTFDKLKASGPVVFVRAIFEREGQKVTLETTAQAPRDAGLRTAAVDPATSLVAKKIQELIKAELVKVGSLSSAALDRVAAAVAKALDPVTTVAAAILDNKQAAKAFDTLAASKPEVQAAVSALAVPVGANSSAGGGEAVARTGGRVGSLAGGAMGFADGERAAARLSFPRDVAMDEAGMIYIADSGNHRIRKLTPDGVMTTIAGGDEEGAADGPGATARFKTPWALAMTAKGELIVLDQAAGALRKIAPGADGKSVVSTLAAGTDAGLKDASGLAVGADGTVYVADSGHHRIAKLGADGKVVTVAGTGEAGFADGAGPAAKFSQPWGVAVGPGGELYVADTGNQRIRRIAPDGAVTTVAGGNERGDADGKGADARFLAPEDVSVDPTGKVIVADAGNHRIRRLAFAADGGATVSTIAGGTQGIADGVGPEAKFGFPGGLSVDKDGDVVVADYANHAIRLINP